MKQIGLVLEGGGMRGIFTGGVLDVFLEEKIDFSYIIGISAGACNAVSYLSRQHGRNLKINTVHIQDKRYLSIGNLLRTGSLFGKKMLFDLLPNQLEPMNFEAYRTFPGTLIAGATNCVTGLCEYFPVPDFQKDYKPLEASMSLPLISPMVSYQEKLLLDGGIADPIPIRKSMLDGNRRNVIVLTQHKEYRKSPSSGMAIIRRKYKQHPRLVEAMERRHLVYNETLDYIGKLETEGKAFVLRPEAPVGISRFEKNPQKLAALYEQGRAVTRKRLEELSAFLSQ